MERNTIATEYPESTLPAPIRRMWLFSLAQAIFTIAAGWVAGWVLTHEWPSLEGGLWWMILWCTLAGVAIVTPDEDTTWDVALAVASVPLAWLRWRRTGGAGVPTVDAVVVTSDPWQYMPITCSLWWACFGKVPLTRQRMAAKLGSGGQQTYPLVLAALAQAGIVALDGHGGVGRWLIPNYEDAVRRLDPGTTRTIAAPVGSDLVIVPRSEAAWIETGERERGGRYTAVEGKR